MTTDPAAVDFLLDTDHITTLQRGEGAAYDRLAPRVENAAAAGAALAVSVVSLHEQVRGVLSELNKKRSNLPRWYRQLEALTGFYAGATVLPFDSSAEEALNRIEAVKTVRRIKTADRRIAAVALANGLPLLTGNRKDFEAVPGLVIEDWLTV